jgi:hypothetical protein
VKCRNFIRGLPRSYARALSTSRSTRMWNKRAVWNAWGAPVQVARVPCQPRLVRRARPQLGALRHLFLTRSYRASERANPVDLPAP